MPDERNRARQKLAPDKKCTSGVKRPRRIALQSGKKIAAVTGIFGNLPDHE